MTDLIKKQLNRTSIRSFKNKKIENDKLELLKKVINASPTSINGQQFSAIIIEDKATKDFIADHNLNQAWIKTAPLLIVFVADINRVRIAQTDMNNIELPILDSPEILLVGTADCAIAATNLFNAALSLDLGGCYLGGIRGNADLIAKKLKLEGQSTPIMAIALGYPDDVNDMKPKVNKIYNNEYCLDTIKTELKAYNVLMEDYYTKRGEVTKRGPKDWSINTALTYRKYYKLDYKNELEKQFKITYFKDDKK